MSIDTYLYPIPPQGVDPKSQRTSLQRGGFASMMDVLTQNETMNQTDNDAFVVPLQEEVIQPTEKTAVHAEESKKQDVVSDVVAASEEPITDQNVTIEENEPVEALIAPVLVNPVPESGAFIPTPEIGSVQVPVVRNVVTQAVEVPTIDVKDVQPLPSYTPTPKAELPAQVEVPFIEDVPEAIMKFLPEVLIPQNEKVTEPEIINAPLKAVEVLPTLPKTVAPLKELKRNIDIQENAKKSEDPKLAPRQMEVFTADSSAAPEVEIEEDPKVRFVRYVEKEIVTPKFAKGQDESLHVPEELQIQKDPQNNPSMQTGAVVGSEKSVRPVSVVTRSEGAQASSVLEKSSMKEELKMPKRPLEQSFAKLLKEAKELAEDFEPEFHAKILRKLEIQVKDPAGIIQLEIAQKEATVHVRAVVPSEAMSDLHYLGQDVQESLQDLGLQLGSYELRSQDQDEEHADFGGMDEIGFDDIETEDVETTNSDYIVDKRV